MDLCVRTTRMDTSEPHHLESRPLEPQRLVGFPVLPRTCYVGLLLLALLAMAARLGAVCMLPTARQAAATYEHGEIAANLVQGRGFSVNFLGTHGPTSQQAPLYPLLLAAAYRVFGVGSATAVLAMQLLQAVAGTLTVLAVAWLGWSLIPERRVLGWVAGVGAAFYPAHVYMVTHMQTVCWSTLNLTLLAAWAASPRGGAGPMKAIGLGLLAGLLLLWDPILLLALPFVAVLSWRSARQRGRPAWPQACAGGPRVGLAGPWKQLLLAACVCAATVMPWLYRNWRVHGEFVFIKSTFGYAFWQGNNPLSWGTDKVPKPSAELLRREHDGTLAGMDRAVWDARRETLYIDDVLLKPTGYHEFAGLSEPARSRLLLRRAMEFIREHPKQYASLCLKRLRYMLLFDETNPKAANRVYRVSTVAWLVLSVVGLLVLRPWWGRLWPTVGAACVLVVFHTFTIASARFRIPLEPLTFVWAAGSVAPFVYWLRPKAWPHAREPDPALVRPLIQTGPVDPPCAQHAPVVQTTPAHHRRVA